MVLKFITLFSVLVISLANTQWLDDEDGKCTTPYKEQGNCIVLNSCQPISDILDKTPKPISIAIRNLLRSYHCGFEGRNPKVCCPVSPNDSSNEPPDVSHHRNANLLPEKCGILDTTDKIVNGNKTGLFEFPWMALLSYKVRSRPDFKCGGTIINDRYILTAAHCLVNLRFPLLGVRVGDHDIRTKIDCETDAFGEETCAPPFQELRIEAIIPHPQYDAKKFVNDIGLIRVSPINLNLENIRPVCLPLAANRNYNFTGRFVTVTGWGITESGRTSPELLKVSLPVIPPDECTMKYKKIIALSERQLCAGGKSDSDSCSGDSGGPLHALGLLHEEYRLIQQGIVSFGPRNCGKEALPGVYTRVAYYMDWILDTIKP